MSKKLRNRLLALVCLLVFLAGGVLFYVNWVVQRPFAVVLFLSDNLSPSTLTAARIYAGGADFRLDLEKFPHLALLTTQANDFAVADSAASAGAVATGQKPNNRTLRLEASRRELGPKGIRVTLIEPGFVESEFQGVAGYKPEWFAEVKGRIGPVLKPEDVARTIGFIVQQPAHVHVSDVLIRPTRQDYP